MNETIFWQIMTPLLTALVVAIGGFITVGFKYLTTLLETKTEALRKEEDRKFAQSLIQKAEDSILTAVVKTNQQLVENLKEASADGKLTKEEMQKAFTTAYEEAISLMGHSVYNQLDEVVADTDKWIKSKIEYFVNQIK